MIRNIAVGIVIAMLAAILGFFTAWRGASRVWSLPCPSLFAWAFTRFYEEGDTK